jgi:putative ABC transport system permease protein
LLLAWFGLQGIQYLYDSPAGLVRLDWIIVLAAVGTAIVSSMIAGLYPAWRVCQVPPATQLKTQ